MKLKRGKKDIKKKSILSVKKRVVNNKKSKIMKKPSKAIKTKEVNKKSKSKIKSKNDSSRSLNSQIALELKNISSKKVVPKFSDTEFTKKSPEVFDSIKGQKTRKEIEKENKKQTKTEASGRKSMVQIAQEIRDEQIKKQREPIINILDKDVKVKDMEFFKTGIEGLDELFDKGIPKGNSILIAGGAGSGKTILCLQTLAHHAMQGRTCLYMSFEEPESKLVQHMEDFGWPARDLVRKNKLRIVRMNPFDVTRNVDALLAKEKGELLIDVDPIITPRDFKNPDVLVIDSLTAIGIAFTGIDESYRIYIEQLFERVSANQSVIREIILATNPTMEGEATAMYIAKQLKVQSSKFKVRSIGRGLPTGADIEYADELTLQRAIKKKKNY